MSKDTSPLAFPVAAGNAVDIELLAPGMTLRQWYAGQAMAGPVAAIVAKYDAQELGQLGGPEFLAERAFLIADAMLSVGSEDETSAPAVDPRDVCVQAVRAAQEALAGWVVPDSTVTRDGVINKLLSILDDEELVKAVSQVKK